MSHSQPPVPADQPSFDSSFGHRRSTARDTEGSYTTSKRRVLNQSPLSPNPALATLPWPDFPVEALRAELLAWYADCGRTLPWRNIDNSYAIWISEIMLQQTQVKTVLLY